MCVHAWLVWEGERESRLSLSPSVEAQWKPSHPALTYLPTSHPSFFTSLPHSSTLHTFQKIEADSEDEGPKPTEKKQEALASKGKLVASSKSRQELVVRCYRMALEVEEVSGALWGEGATAP
jgi:hypothetical protein